MAIEDEWSTHNNQNNWGAYDYNASWNDDSTTAPNPTNSYSTSSYHPTNSQAVQHQQQRNSGNTAGKKDGFSLFLAESNIPTWDD